ncbi:Molybdopterin-guanine dinucleotide biosynthesis protein A [Parafrankia irregularis]|uniref:Molybdopterin-guanine dinucleotide biosynthesis protein A n=1 Tax=Parafrankia irregularis TaxID=795642 RepID=A0A0S4QMA3_9ACTN|nr:MULTISPECIES: NTP transferase domain-containing protein [Parafrankia]MBE3205525.1 NTP transferase domain-containing protein [Parafrankia sp. CH37]CUU55578.1 Molybdopterin-guanine dinucleotide biosynthesis protein A [Parafrankia irregularis]
MTAPVPGALGAPGTQGALGAQGFQGAIGVRGFQGVQGDAEPWDALVLAGGAARRMGGDDKAVLSVGGARLLDRVLDAVAAARTVVVVGPQRPPVPGTRAVRWAREDPPGGGPVAAIAAGLRLVTATRVVVLAVDLPFLGAAEVHGLLDAVAAGGGPGGPQVALLSDPAQRPQYLAAAWRTVTLRAVLPVDPAGRSVRSLLAGQSVRTVAATERVCLDCDDPAALAVARAWAVSPVPVPDPGPGPGPGPLPE